MQSNSNRENEGKHCIEMGEWDFDDVYKMNE